MTDRQEETRVRKARAIEVLSRDNDHDIAWLLIHLGSAVERRVEQKPESYDLSYVKSHLANWTSKISVE